MVRDKRRWTTSQQQAWLEGQYPAYSAVQVTGRYDKFWPTFFQQWFNEFPAPEPRSDDPTDSEHESDSDSEQTDGELRPKSSKRKRQRTKPNPKRQALDNGDGLPTSPKPLTPEEKLLKKKGRIIDKMKERLKAHMRRNCTITKKPRTKPSATSSSIFNTASRTHRRLQETEIYSRLYYKERIAPVVNERRKALGADVKSISVVKGVTKELWDNEDLDVKEVVAKERAKAQTLEPDVPERTPQQFQDAIDELPTYLEEVLHNITELTGLTVSVIFGGPIPKANGTISSSCVHMGKNNLGNTFGDAYTDFDSNVTTPFHKFLRGVYTADVRASRAFSSIVTPSLADLEVLDEPMLDEAPDTNIVNAKEATPNLSERAITASLAVVGPHLSGPGISEDGNAVAEYPNSPSLSDEDPLRFIPLDDSQFNRVIANKGNLVPETNSGGTNVPGTADHPTTVSLTTSPHHERLQIESTRGETVPSTEHHLPPCTEPLVSILPHQPLSTYSAHALKDRAELEARAAAETRIALAVSSDLAQRPKPRPAYLIALEARAAATAEANVKRKPDEETKAKAEKEAKADKSNGKGRASKGTTPLAEPPPSRHLLCQPELDDVSAAAEVRGQRVRRLTELGMQHEKELDKRRERLQKAAVKKASSTVGPGKKATRAKRDK